MKTFQLQQLAALRALREEKAVQQWAAQRYRREAAQHALGCAQQHAQHHGQRLASHTEYCFGRFREGIAVGDWHTAQAQLAALAEDQQQLEAQVLAAHQNLAFHRDEEAALRRERVRRQRQLEASEWLVGQRLCEEQRQHTCREDDDASPTPLASVRP